jgi:nucleoside 2-deoxyribosyltransferase
LTLADGIRDSTAIVYVAGRLFDLDQKLSSERLEEAVLLGLSDALGAPQSSLPDGLTFVPFRDAKQEALVAADKTRQLFDLDIGRLRRTALLVSYIDGLSKDEGVCFEIGFAYGVGASILLVSTDFFDLELPSGQEYPLDPLLVAAATELIRRPQLLNLDGSFRHILLTSRASVMQAVRTSVRNLLAAHAGPAPPRAAPLRSDGPMNVFLEFGGTVYEWQRHLQERVQRAIPSGGRIQLLRSHRYDSNTSARAEALRDFDVLCDSHLLITCTDADEAPPGAALLQGLMFALNRPVWMYNSKRTALRAAGGYRSSRNLMLDHSASRVFSTIDELTEELCRL